MFSLFFIFHIHGLRNCPAGYLATRGCSAIESNPSLKAQIQIQAFETESLAMPDSIALPSNRGSMDDWDLHSQTDL